LIVRRSGELIASEDHKPDRPDELRRIRDAGGFVSDADAARAGALATVVARLDGNLAVSRGLGDFTYKKDSGRPPSAQKVSCVPELFEAGLASPPLRAGDLVILACDGVFDVVTNEQLAALVARALAAGDDPGDVCARVLQTCLSDLHSKDNMTLMVLEVGVNGARYGLEPRGAGADDSGASSEASDDEEGGGADEIVGLEKYDRQTDDAVKRSYRAFLEYCKTTNGGQLPGAARRLLRRASATRRSAPRPPSP
jgi:serine/threonine protein phosphatase PrpC